MQSILLFSSLQPFPLCWLTYCKAQAAFSNASWDKVSSSLTPLRSLWLPLQSFNYLYLVILSVINSFAHAHSLVWGQAKTENANTAKMREIRLAVVESSKYIVFQMQLKSSKIG